MAKIEIKSEILKAARYFRREAARRSAPAVSRLFTVLDHGGGWRFVVTPYAHIKYHLGPRERAIMVPQVRIAEPVDWHDVPRTIRLAERYTTLKTAGRNACGGCRQCCITLRIDAEGINKPAHATCHFVDDCTGGCGIYPSRPPVCKSYECEWLKSQRTNDRMPLHLRPDKCGVIFQSATAAQGFDPDILEAHPCRPGVFEPANVRHFISKMTKFGKRVVKITHYLS